MKRVVDYVYLVYFITHIPITIMFDTQALLPSFILDFFPKQVIEMKRNYCMTYKDAMMADPPSWYQSFLFCEMFLQFPFFFVASYGFYKGLYSMLRLPCLLYGTHVATTLLPILMHVWTHDFSKDSLPGPSTTQERLQLTYFYSPYLAVPIVLIMDTLFSSVYKDQAYVLINEDKKIS